MALPVLTLNINYDDEAGAINYFQTVNIAQLAEQKKYRTSCQPSRARKT